MRGRYCTDKPGKVTPATVRDKLGECFVEAVVLVSRAEAAPREGREAYLYAAMVHLTDALHSVRCLYASATGEVEPVDGAAALDVIRGRR
jgi:hypothetical protein